MGGRKRRVWVWLLLATLISLITPQYTLELLKESVNSDKVDLTQVKTKIPRFVRSIRFTQGFYVLEEQPLNNNEIKLIKYDDYLDPIYTRVLEKNSPTLLQIAFPSFLYADDDVILFSQTTSKYIELEEQNPANPEIYQVNEPISIFSGKTGNFLKIVTISFPVTLDINVEKTIKIDFLNVVVLDNFLYIIAKIEELSSSFYTTIFLVFDYDLNKKVLLNTLPKSAFQSQAANPRVVSLGISIDRDDPDQWNIMRLNQIRITTGNSTKLVYVFQTTQFSPKDRAILINGTKSFTIPNRGDRFYLEFIPQGLLKAEFFLDEIKDYYKITILSYNNATVKQWNVLVDRKMRFSTNSILIKNTFIASFRRTSTNSNQNLSFDSIVEPDYEPFLLYYNLETQRTQLINLTKLDDGINSFISSFYQIDEHSLAIIVYHSEFGYATLQILQLWTKFEITLIDYAIAYSIPYLLILLPSIVMFFRHPKNKIHETRDKDLYPEFKPFC